MRAVRIGAVIDGAETGIEIQRRSNPARDRSQSGGPQPYLGDRAQISSRSPGAARAVRAVRRLGRGDVLRDLRLRDHPGRATRVRAGLHPVADHADLSDLLVLHLLTAAW